MSDKRVCFGLSVYNESIHLERALESILRQSFDEFMVYIFDNGSTDHTGEILRLIASRDRRVFLEKSARNLGMINGFRRVFEIALSDSPKMEYFSWLSGHDLWDPDWLQSTVREMDNNPRCVLVYPIAGYIDPEGNTIERKVLHFETQGFEEVRKRFRYVCWHIRGAGNMAYGLYRSQALFESGVYRRVLLPDRLLMMELSLRGQFRQVQQVLWYRRIYPVTNITGVRETVRRQKVTLFESNKTPLYAAFPWWSIFGAVFFANYFLKHSCSKTTTHLDAIWMSLYLMISQCCLEIRKAHSIFLKKLYHMIGNKWLRVTPWKRRQ